MMTYDEVPGADDMGNETFIKHINARHKQDLGLNPKGPDLHYDITQSEGLIDTHRAFHRRCHDLALPEQYDHEHEGKN